MKRTLILCIWALLAAVALSYAETWYVRVNDCAGSFYKYTWYNPAESQWYYAYDDTERDYWIEKTTMTVDDFVQIDGVSTAVSTTAAAISAERVYCTHDSFTKELKARTGE